MTKTPYKVGDRVEVLRYTTHVPARYSGGTVSAVAGSLHTLLTVTLDEPYPLPPGGSGIVVLEVWRTVNEVRRPTLECRV